MGRRTALIVILGALAVAIAGSVAYLEASGTSSDPAIETAVPSAALSSPTLSSTTTESAATISSSTTSTPPSTTTTLAPTTLAPTTLAPTTLAPTTLPPPERPLVPVVVTSATLDGQRVGPTVYLLSLSGWSDIRGVNGAVQLPATIVYYAEGFQNAAELMAADLQIPVTSVAPLVGAPPVAGLGNAALLVYLGLA